MEARADDCRSRREAGEEGLCPRADDHRRAVIDGENAMRVNPLGAEDRLRAEAEEWLASGAGGRNSR